MKTCYNNHTYRHRETHIHRQTDTHTHTHTQHKNPQINQSQQLQVKNKREQKKEKTRYPIETHPYIKSLVDGKVLIQIQHLRGSVHGGGVLLKLKSKQKKNPKSPNLTSLNIVGHGMCDTQWALC